MSIWSLLQNPGSASGSTCVPNRLLTPWLGCETEKEEGTVVPMSPSRVHTPEWPEDPHQVHHLKPSTLSL